MSGYNYKIIVQYDGSRYKGWQVQNSTEDTIQGKLERVISSLLQCEIALIGSGRTDAGVHAIGQVANFHCDVCIDEKDFLDKLNHYLPEDIAVVAVEHTADRFHARYSAVSKTYRYRIHIGEISNVFERKYVYSYKGKSLDVNKMIMASQHMLGEQDYKCFCGNKHMKKSTVRNVMAIDILQKENEIQIDFTGDGFLQNMIRIMTGTLIEVGNGSKKVEDIPKIIAGKNRELAGFTAPPEGLCLMNVEYKCE